MRWYSMLAIYSLFWFLSLFAMLPLGVRTTGEVGGERVPGQADSAPHVFRPWPVVWRTSLCAGLFFALFYWVYRMGWIDVNLPANAAERLPG
jgi:predicted secreted protein